MKAFYNCTNRILNQQNEFLLASICQIFFVFLRLIENVQIVGVRQRVKLIKSLSVVKFAISQEVIFIEDLQKLLNVDLLGSFRISHREVEKEFC